MKMREEKMEIIEQLSQQIYSLCDDVMTDLEGEMSEAELIESCEYLACNKLTRVIREVLLMNINKK
ncbi:MAG: hypothetical protein RR513_09110 [Muribaculaceae bacterium]